MGILFLAWLYLTPIIYPFSVIPAEIRRHRQAQPDDGHVTCATGPPVRREASRNGSSLAITRRGRSGRWSSAWSFSTGSRAGWRKSCDRSPARRRGGQCLEEVPAHQGTERLAEGHYPARPPGCAEDFWALRDVSFEVYQGETFGLIGENGSGKSTMLKCLTKILRPNRGTVAVNGKVSALLELGAGFHPELSGRENVYLNGAILGLSQKELRRRFDEHRGVRRESGRSSTSRSRTTRRDVCAPRFLGGHQRRSGRSAGGRGPRGRRRELPAQVQREVHRAAQ